MEDWDRLSERPLTAEAVDEVMSGMDVPENLGEMLKTFGKKGIEKIFDGCYMARGFGLANSFWLEGPDGAVVVDTLDSLSGARKVMQGFRQVSDKKVKAIILTHHHQDHTDGTKAFVEDENNPPEIWAYHTFMTELEKLGRVKRLARVRGGRQFGVHLYTNMAFAKRNVPRLSSMDANLNSGFMEPTHFLRDDSQSINVAGMNIELVHIPGETDDQIGVWLPDKRAMCCADDIYQAFPNISAIRGTTNRDALQWARSLKTIMALKPLYLLPGHTKVVQGEEKIRDLLTNYSDAIEYVHNETVKLMNTGLGPEEIVRRVNLPAHLANHPYLKELYGTVAWSVRSIFNAYVGWFSGDPVDLCPLPRKEKAERMIEFAGGRSAILTAAETALDKQDWQWALELSSHVAQLDYTDKRAVAIKVKAIQKLASKETSMNGRNYYLTSAVEALTFCNDGDAKL